MEALVILGVAVVGIGMWLVRKQLARQAELNRQAEREAQREEERRVRECGEVVLLFANRFGYIAREAISRGELARLIDNGISPGELADTIWGRVADVEGLALGKHPVGGTAIPVLLPTTHRSRHVYMVGRSGSGKTTLIRNLVLQDLMAGHGIGVIAPEQELLVEELLPFIPAERWDDVIYVNPADTDCPVPLNPLHVDEGEDLDLKVDETLTIFRRVFDEDGGGSAPRMETILRQALYLLMQIPGTTLLDIERLLDRQDDSFRTWALERITDEDTRRFWTSTYASYPRDAHLPIANRLGRFLKPKVVRNILCSSGKSLNIREAMDTGKVLLFNLSDGILGEANAQLLGQLVVAKIQMAAMSRANIPKSRRQPFYLYIDEFQSFCGVAATSYEKILSRARKYNLGLILAHQQTGQIPEHLMREILGNVSTVISFSVGASDARRLGREMVGEINGEPVGLESQELLSLRIGEAFCKIDRSVFFMRTYPPPEDGRAFVRDEVVKRSRENYGKRPDEVVPQIVHQHQEATAGGVNLEEIDPGEVFG